MEGILTDYHIWFMTLAIVFLMLEGMILFVSEHTTEKIIFAVILASINANICWISMLSFFSLNIPGFDTSGNLVNNPTAGMWVFFAVFFGLFFINMAFIIYSHVALMTLYNEKKAKAKNVSLKKL